MITIIWRDHIKPGFPAKEEPTELARSDRRRLDGVSLIPWDGGRCLASDGAVIDTMTESYRTRSVEVVGAAAKKVADRRAYNFTAI